MEKRTTWEAWLHPRTVWTVIRPLMDRKDRGRARVEEAETQARTCATVAMASLDEENAMAEPLLEETCEGTA